MNNYSELKKYIDLECIESSECLDLLIQVMHYHDYLDAELTELIHKELTWWLDWYKTHTKIREAECTTTCKYYELERFPDEGIV